MPDPVKITQAKIETMVKLLDVIAANIAEFDKGYATLTDQEKLLVGGIVFNITSPWNEKNFIGTVVERPIGAQLVNALVKFFNDPPQIPQQPGSSLFIPMKGGGKDGSSGGLPPMN
jgi:hypothetical protein